MISQLLTPPQALCGGPPPALPALLLPSSLHWLSVCPSPACSGTPSTVLLRGLCCCCSLCLELPLPRSSSSSLLLGTQASAHGAPPGETFLHCFLRGSLQRAWGPAFSFLFTLSHSKCSRYLSQSSIILFNYLSTHLLSHPC